MFERRGLLLAVVLCGSACASAPGGTTTQAAPAAKSDSYSQAQDPADELFTVSFRAGTRDPNGVYLAGTETMNFAVHQGKLYAGVGLDLDTLIRQPNPDETTPGPQILVRASAKGDWYQDHAFSAINPADQRRLFRRLTALQEVTLARTEDPSGNAVDLAQPVSLLIAGLTTNYSAGGAIFIRDDEQNTWVESPFPQELAPVLDEVRAIGLYRDPITGVDRVLFGGRSNQPSKPSAIVSGVYDPTVVGKIRWNPQPELTGLDVRVMAFAELDGALYCAAKPSVYKRTINGPSPAWQEVYSYPPPAKLSAGLRGLTTVLAPDGNGEVMLGGTERHNRSILAFRSTDLRHPVVELNVSEFLSPLLGTPPDGYGIEAYNDMPPATDPDSGETVHLIGLGVGDSPTAEDAWFLSRTMSAEYALHRVPHFDHPEAFPADAPLRGLRAMIVSPFPEDAGRVLYLGGFDTHVQPCHNSAWMVRVGLRTALAPFVPGAQ
jgi:hypothetical protein